MNLATNYLGLITQSAVAGAGSLAELQPSARLGKNFPVGWWVARKAENKAKAQHNWALGLAELGKNKLCHSKNLFIYLMQSAFFDHNLFNYWLQEAAIKR